MAALTIATLWSSQSLAQSGAPLSDIDWSKEAENPLTRHITLPLRYEAEFQDGADKLTKSTLKSIKRLCRSGKRRLGAHHPHEAPSGSAATEEPRRS